jgi:hypothetical protein
MTPSLHNRRGFFSDYWVGSIFARRETAAPRLTSAKLDKLLWRVSQIGERVATLEPPDLTTFREKFARPLLEEVWGYALGDPAEEAHFRLLLPSGGMPVAAGTQVPALYLCPDADELDASGPRQRLEALIAEHGLTYGFLLSPQMLRLIRRKGEGAKGASFDVSLAGIAERADRDSLDTARRLLHCVNFLSLDGKPPPIVAMEEESLRHRARVSAALKDAVFQSAEIAIRGLLADLRQRPDEMPAAPPLEALRDVGLLLLYRLLFILYAESRDERLQNHGLYRRVYSLEGMVDRLLRTPSDRIARNSFEQWALLQATFRIFDEGLPPMPGLENIPPRGGPLFSENSHDGEWLAKLRLCDADVATLLLGLATARPRQGVGRERISYRELAIEQLGSVYEGLLEYEPRLAETDRIEVRLGGRDLALLPDELRELCRLKHLDMRGDTALLVGVQEVPLPEEPEGNEEDEASDETDVVEADSDSAEDAEESDDSKASVPGATVRLLRRIETGSFFFMPGHGRKASGSFYTPTPMVDDLVRAALAPVVRERSSSDIEALRVLDMACGSAHFLVGAARFLGHALHGAYRREFESAPPPAFHPAHELTDAVRHDWDQNGEAWCKRRIVEKCLFGVDLNPTAVQLAQVALWIESLAGDRPLSFFAHHVRCGNSLLGTWGGHLHSPPHPDLGRGTIDRSAGGLFEFNVQNLIREAVMARTLIDAPLPPDVRPDTPDEYAYKSDRQKEAERVLARAHLLYDLRCAAIFVSAIWSDWLSLVEAHDLEGVARVRPWWERFDEVRKRERFFHWELEFPEVFSGARPGFDAVLGNPPWDKVLPAKLDFYAGHDALIRVFAGAELDRRIRHLHTQHPAIAGQYKNYEADTLALARALRGGGDYPLSRGRTAAAHEDLSKFFLEQGLRVAATDGAVALVLPSVVYNGDGCAGLRRQLVENSRIERFYAFENRRKVFPIDCRYKFVNLCARKTRPGRDASFDVAFMRQDLAELETAGPKPWTVTLSRDEIARLSPESWAFLEYRGPRDQDIIRKMSTGRPTLGGEEPGNWGTELFTDFAHRFTYNATRDRDLWTDPASGRCYTPASVLGARAEELRNTDLRSAMRTAGFVPLYEGKHIEQFLVGIQPVRWWASIDAAKAKYGRPPDDTPMLVFRETASNTNERTCIAAVLPAGSAGSHKLSGLLVGNVGAVQACSVLNSLAFDYALRFRTAGTNISFTYMRPMPVPPAAMVNALPVIETRMAWELNTSHVTADQSLWPALWSVNRAVAQAYGLGPDDFAHILASFPVMARKRAAFVAYLREHVAEWKKAE